MGLPPEEKKRIYEEEKARIEAQEKIEREKQAAEGSTITGLKPNAAALLCYVLGWVTGIIFLLLEQKNKFVRFHAVQSIIVFGILTVTGRILGWIPIAGVVFSSIIGVVGFILWIILMVKAYNGQLYKLPWAGDIAGKMVGISANKAKEDTEGKKDEYPKPPAEPPSPPIADSDKRIGNRVEDYFKNARSGRITSSSFAIAWSFVLLIFFHFFNKYIAYYQHQAVDNVTEWTRYPVLTADFNAWLPILTTTLILSIIGHVILIIFDKHLLRQIILVVLNCFGIATVLTLLSIFPFDFSVIPNTDIAAYVNLGVTIALIVISVGLGVGTIVRFIKLMVNISKKSTNY